VTGYAIGGIPPVGHARAIRTFVDEDLLLYDVVYAAGGTPNALFPIRPADLLRVCGEQAADVKN
jgi:prolyl-tRNA editing enzyme YbaK/EbsC (Cys-tRNA(Pro) deacylase)